MRNSEFRNFAEVLACIEQMNRQACKIGLRSTFFDSPHGLVNPKSMSTALDLAKLCAILIEKEPIFCQIVGTRNYTVTKNKNGTHNKRTYRWENTHRMLEQRCVYGIKTGVTTNAGPCLATAMKIDDQDLIVILLNSKDMEVRWVETWKLAKWTDSRL